MNACKIFCSSYFSIDIEESAKGSCHSLKFLYVFINRFYFVAIKFLCLIYDFKLAVLPDTYYIAQPIFLFLSFAMLGLLYTSKTF